MSHDFSRIARHAVILLCASGACAMLGGLLRETAVQAAPQHKPKGRATLTGVVLGPDDKPVPHASITYQSSFGARPHALRADARGRFTIANLAADNYDLRATSKGFFSEWTKNVALKAGGTKSITLRLIYSRQPLKPRKSTKP